MAWWELEWAKGGRVEAWELHRLAMPRAGLGKPGCLERTGSGLPAWSGDGKPSAIVAQGWSRLGPIEVGIVFLITHDWELDSMSDSCSERGFEVTSRIQVKQSSAEQKQQRDRCQALN